MLEVLGNEMGFGVRVTYHPLDESFVLEFTHQAVVVLDTLGKARLLRQHAPLGNAGLFRC